MRLSFAKQRLLTGCKNSEQVFRFRYDSSNDSSCMTPFCCCLHGRWLCSTAFSQRCCEVFSNRSLQGIGITIFIDHIGLRLSISALQYNNGAHTVFEMWPQATIAYEKVVCCVTTHCIYVERKHSVITKNGMFFLLPSLLFYVLTKIRRDSI